jgi:hypothetical protein
MLVKPLPGSTVIATFKFLGAAAFANILVVSRDNGFGILTDFGLGGCGVGVRVVWRQDISRIHTGSGTHRASCAMGTENFSLPPK